MTPRSRLDEFARPAGRGMGAREFVEAVIDRMRWAVRADRACVISVDPESLLVTETVTGRPSASPSRHRGGERPQGLANRRRPAAILPVRIRRRTRVRE